MIFKKDTLQFGLILGFIAPVLSLIVFYAVKFYPLFSVTDMFGALRGNTRLVTAITVSCLFLNIILFTIYTNTRRDKTARGIFIVTLLFAISSLVFKFTA